jgi:hypothetical protein
MTYQEQNAKYAIGTVIEMSGSAVKADNGRFRISGHFNEQPNGTNYFQWKRINKKGEVLATVTSANLRGGRFTCLEKFAKIVS